MPTLPFLSFTLHEICIGGPKIHNVDQVSLREPFDLILQFSVMASRVECALQVAS